MGSGSSLALQVADSTVTPGQQVVLSEPIEQDFDIFLDESLAFLKYPVPPQQEPVLKECKVVDDGLDSFTVKVILDGAKLAQYGFGNPEDPTLDRVEQLCKVTADRAKRSLNTTQFKPHWVGEKDDEKIFEAHATFLSDPLRIEYYWIMPDGERKADDTVLGALQPVVNAVMGMLADRKVAVKLHPAKPSAMSEPVDESIITHEALFNAIITVIQSNLKPTVEEISETKAKLIYPGENSPTAVLSWDKDQGTITQEMSSPKGEKLASTRYKLSKDPVILEVESMDAEGKNVTGLGTARAVQVLMDGAIASTTGSWFGGLF